MCYAHYSLVGLYSNQRETGKNAMQWNALCDDMYNGSFMLLAHQKNNSGMRIGQGTTNNLL